MSKLNINIGTEGNDNTGDSIRETLLNYMLFLVLVDKLALQV
jgi:hypothetical protein